MEVYHLEFATLIARSFLGFLFLFQGYDKLFNIGFEGVIDAFSHPPGRRSIPRPLLGLAAYYTSIVEFFGGILLILGLFKYVTLYLLGIDLILVAIAFGMVQPVWDMRHVYPRLTLLLFLSLIPADWDIYSIDNLIE